jgi:hypothetical protein
MLPLKWGRTHLAYVIGSMGFVVLMLVVPNLAAFNRDQQAYVRLVRAIKTARFGVAHPTGLAFVPQTNAFLVLDARGAADPALITPLADPAGSVRLPTALTDPLNIAFDRAAQRLVAFDAATSELVAIQAPPERGLDPATLTHVSASRFGLHDPRGLTVDPTSGDLFVLDGAGPRIVRIAADPRQLAAGLAALRDGRIAQVDLRPLGVADLHGLAFNPRDGHLSMVSRTRQTLYEITTDGQLVATRDLAGAKATLGDPQGMVFAPSGDQTDDPANLSLYIADSRLNDPWNRSGRIVELSLTQPAHVDVAANTVQPILVQTIDTSRWSPPSPDPMDITYLPASNHLLVSDSEVEEVPQVYWHGVNQFEVTLSGSLVKTYTTFTADPMSLTPRNFSSEPSGVVYNALNRHWVYSDDDVQKVFDVDLGADGVFGTGDDIVTAFKVKPCGDNDAESITVDTQRGHLLLADGQDSELFDIAPGPNGVFDGCPPEGDDQATHFDTARLGILDPEGVAYNPDNGHLYITGFAATKVIETTITGSLVAVFDLSSLNIDNPSGLAYAPSSVNPAVKTLYISARGKDNNTDPNENDGKVYEIALAPLPPTPTRTPTPTNTPTRTPTRTPTPTATPTIRRTFLPYIAK